MTQPLTAAEKKARLQRAKADLLLLLQPGGEKRVLATLKKHALAIDLVFGAVAPPRFTGTTAAEALAFFQALEAFWKDFTARTRRDLSIEVTCASAWPKRLSAVLRSRSKSRWLASWRKEEPGAADFFARRWPMPPTARAAALLDAPHDLEEAKDASFCTPRPWRGAPASDLLDYLLQRKESRAATEAQLAELEALVLAQLRGAALPALDLTLEPKALWQALDRALAQVDVGLTVMARPKSIEVQPYVLLPKWPGGPLERVYGSMAVGAAIDAMLAAAGLPTVKLLELAERDRALKPGYVGQGFQAIRWYTPDIRTKAAPGSHTAKTQARRSRIDSATRP